MLFTWNKVATIKLISLMEKHEELWKVSSEKYGDKRLKRETMKVCAELMQREAPGVTAGDILARVTSLRRTFRREQKKVRASRAAGMGLASSWWGYERLLFLQADQAASALSSTQPQSVSR